MSAVLRTLAAAAALAAFLCASAGARLARADDPPVGPKFGESRFAGAIRDQPGGADADDFVQDLLQGERLTVEVKSARKKTPRAVEPVPAEPPKLKPVLVLVDPDGVVRSAGVRTSADGRRTGIDDFLVDKTGRWAARVSGADDTRGGYEIRFRIQGAPPIAYTHQRLGDDQPPFRIHEFAAFDGVTLDARLKWDAKLEPVQIRALTDPAGADVLVPDAAGPVPAVSHVVAKRNRLDLRGVVLDGGDGDYALRVRAPDGRAQYDLTLRLRAPARPASRKPVVLTDAEPFLAPLEFPIAADVGVRVHLDGANFSTGMKPRVLFGRAEATDLQVTPDGKSIDVVVPPKSGLDVVSVAVVNPDGQTAFRSNYFAYVQPPAITDIVDAATLLPVHAGSTNGGRAVRLLGQFLRPGQVLTFTQGTAATTVRVTLPPATETSVPITLPAALPGVYTITVSDAFGRSGAAPFTFLFKTPPSFAADPYTPGALKLFIPVTVTIRGAGFEPEDELYFAGALRSSTYVDATTRLLDLEALAEGSYAVRLVDRIGTQVDGPSVEVKLPPILNFITVVSGPAIGNDIPMLGGAVIRVTGANFVANDHVTLGSSEVTDFIQRGRTIFDFRAPPSPAGLADLTVTDGAGQSATLLKVVRYAGFVDASSAHVPAPDTTDDFGAMRGVVGDLDRDGSADDLVLVSSYLAGAPGTRTEHARLLTGNGAGALVDRTGTNMPLAFSDSFASETFDAQAVAIGDVDGKNGADILLGGVGANYGYGVYGTASQTRLLTNSGNGTFTLDEANSMPSRYVTGVFAYYGGYSYTVKGAISPASLPTAIAVGDLDKDGDVDVLVGHDSYDQRLYGVSPSIVDYTTSPPSLHAPAPYYTGTFKYFAALRVYENKIAAGQHMVDASAQRLASVGDSINTLTQPPALHARDLALGDIDRDGDLDVIVAWDDPRTVTAYGLYTNMPYSYLPPPPPQTATQVLLNDGKGKLTVATSTWLPLGVAPEFWQANRAKLADLDGDGDLDLVMVHARGIDAYLGTNKHDRHALRVLRNDGTRFTDVSATALPAVNAAISEDQRGNALAVRDVNGDGFLDILVSTQDALKDASGAARTSLRLYAGRSGLKFLDATAFLPDQGKDSGEALQLLFADDLGGTGKQPLLLLDENVPGTRTDARPTRSFDWKK